MRRPHPRRRLLSAAAVLAAVLLGGAVLWPSAWDRAGEPSPGGQAALPGGIAAPAGAGHSPAAASPLARRTTVVVSGAVTALARRLDSILVNTDACLEVRDAGGNLLYAHRPGAALGPASTQKLLVAAAALDVLGPGYRFVTSVVATRRPQAGEVDNLWLVGGGDPVLSSPEYTAFLMGLPMTAGRPVTTQLMALVDQLAAGGVRSVPGGIHGDDSRYDRTRFLPSWRPSYAQEGDVAPLGALEVDDGLDHWHPAVLTADPAAHSAGVLARLATTAGIAAAQSTDGVAPRGGVVLAAVQSPPLSDIVTAMLRDSDNTTAEMVVRELDRVEGGKGTTAGGVAVVEREVAHLGLPTAGLEMVDGSGLSPLDRVSCDTLLDALDLGARPPFAAMGLLSVAGEFGTLVDNFGGTPAVGHLEAKSGYIDGVAGLVGRMDTGPPLSFSFLINGPLDYLGGIRYEDRVVGALAAFSGR